MIKKEKETSLFDIVKLYLAHFIIFSLISFVLLLVTTLIQFTSEDPIIYAEPTGKIVLFVSCFLSGFIITKRKSEHSLFSSIILGAILAIAVFLSSLLFTTEEKGASYIWFVLIPVFTFLGSLIGKKRSIKRKAHRRK